MKIQYILELAGTYFFAISGVLATEDKHRNWFGVAFTGFVTAIGGGSLRDMMLGSFPLVWIGDVNFLYGIILGVITAFAFFNHLAKLRRTMLLFDMVGIAFFTILGVEKALSLGVSPEIAAIMGVFTAVMGGVIRDTLTNQTPVIFNKEIYATACLAGAILYLVLIDFVDRNSNLLISSSLIIMIRIIAIKFNVELPRLGAKEK
ncbi:MAG TPA: trimeric intracellular cation channel family protein [Chryseosolibacter sp.]